jgi:23S rRNA (uracil1939-C5)-methyltransferase
MEDIIKIDIESYDNFGRGVGRCAGVVVFVRGAILGETVLAKVNSKKKKFWEADAIEIIKASPERGTPCIYATKCGGCDLTHMSYNEELRLKKDKVRQAFWGADIEIPDVIPSPETLNYRNKSVFHIKGGAGGMYAKGTHDIIPIETCMIHKKEALDMLRNETEKIKNGEICVRFDQTGRAQTGEFEASFCGNKFMVSKESFLQVNYAQAENIYNFVLEAIRNFDLVFDLYSGIGTMSLGLARDNKSVIGVEIARSSFKDAKYNASLNKINNIEFINLDTKNFDFEKYIKPRSSVVLDPPRAGADAQTLANILKNADKISKIVYVSCDARTLARDAKILEEKYELKKLQPFDMFPKTHHIETVAVLEAR